jgi:hypothetical protein
MQKNVIDRANHQGGNESEKIIVGHGLDDNRQQISENIGLVPVSGRRTEHEKEKACDQRPYRRENDVSFHPTPPALPQFPRMQTVRQYRPIRKRDKNARKQQFRFILACPRVRACRKMTRKAAALVCWPHGDG